MFSRDADFAGYASDFYVGQLSAQQRAVVAASTDRLRAFAAECSACRWQGLLAHLGEAAGAQPACGRCDNCANAAQYAGDTERDFAPLGRVLLGAVRDRPAQAWTHLEKALAASPRFGALRPRRAAKTLREFLPGLEAMGLLARQLV